MPLAIVKWNFIFKIIKVNQLYKKFTKEEMPLNNCLMINEQCKNINVFLLANSNGFL